MKRKFELGNIVITSKVYSAIAKEDISRGLARHMCCDWGECADPEMNDYAVENNDGRILSVYRDHKGARFWIITEADRSATTVLLPEDY
ncbi:hypothetical protein AGMMS49975_15850 [Clostridia bacterium]|nr:hypothetical protein AGMMS49975_15850 [Clostridia bacterium]